MEPCVFLITSDVKHSFMCFMAIFIYLFVNCLTFSLKCQDQQKELNECSEAREGRVDNRCSVD